MNNEQKFVEFKLNLCRYWRFILIFVNLYFIVKNVKYMYKCVI